MLNLFSFLWNVILVLIFNMVISYMRRLAIEMHCTRMHKFFIDQHPGNNCVLFIELFTNRHVPAIKKNNQSVFLFQLLQFDYEIWEIIIYFTTCFSFWRLFYSLPTFCTKYLLKTTNIWVITIVVVLDQSTVTFQKGWGRGLLQFVWY